MREIPPAPPLRAPRAKPVSPFSPFRVELGRSPKMPEGAAASRSLEKRLFNRDLSWLRFNDRVLAEAADRGVPALERLRFATIVSSNLDEFFMVRGAEIARIARRQPQMRFPDGMTASQVHAQIREQVLRQKGRQAEILDDLLLDLQTEGIKVHADFDSDRSLDALIQSRLPKLTLSLRRSSEPLPALPSARIHVFVRFPGQYAVIAIEERQARLLELPPDGKQRRYALTERWLSARAAEIFPDLEVIEAFPFKIIRDADLRYHPDDEESLEEQIVTAIQKRQKARVVRLEVDAPTYSEGALFLATALGLDSAALYRFDLPLDLRTLALLYNEPGADRLRYAPIQPQIPAPFRKKTTVFDAIRRKDRLLHHPYDSFDIVVRFLQAAAVDPQVNEIKHTLYRTSRESPVIEALKDAAQRGKRVTVYVEIKARFDELNNVRTSGELKRAGVRVVQPLGRHKVHSKLTQVIRLEDGKEVSYLHLGTGNYHPVTARQYTDLGLLTADQDLGRDIAAYFTALSKGSRPAGSEDLMVAPGSLHGRFRKLIQEEIDLHKEKGGGRIIAKVNSLVDPEIIEALYQASQAGVSVELLVRGICCLLPGLKGLSENIRVVSVIDRFLEHSRIYYFHAGGAEKLYLSSADWMPRNFYNRYEIAFPVKDPILKGYVRDVIMAKGLSDNVKAWTLKPDGSYTKLPAPAGAAEVRSQLYFEALAKEDYRDTGLELRGKAKRSEPAPS